MKNIHDIKFSKDNNTAVERISTTDFSETGLLILINIILHNFGLCIVRDPENDILYPARTTFRGISLSMQNKMYKKIGEYINKSSKWLAKETKEEINM